MSEKPKREVRDRNQIVKKLKIYQEEHQRLTVLFNITRNISTELKLDLLLLIIMDEVRKALKADRCTVFLLDRDKKELWSKVAHGERDIRFPSNLGIAGHVVATGDVLNIPDAYADPRFNPEIDKKTGYLTRNILAFPMRNRLGEIMGVFQVLNKYEGTFTKQDEQLLDAISAIAATQLENAQLYEEQKKTLESFVGTLASTIDARDPLTAGHSNRIALYSDEIAQMINLPQKRRELLRYAALLHDYGKIAIREAVLCKNGSLSIDEYCHIQEHAAYTQSILEKINFSRDFKDVPKIAASHHEKMNGSGYPEGLVGDQIPIESRILSVADVFDALTSKRHYRDRMEFENVMDILMNNAGSHFDRNIIEAFKKIKIDRLIEILEGEYSQELDQKDLRYLSHFEIRHLLEVIRDGPLNDEEKKMSDLFYKYYYRKYLPGPTEKAAPENLLHRSRKLAGI
ncbi:MAG: GAF domain-containing protein [candidate division KSB1 bacterium]|nr:GAF domain-containing protein [candidate division KSB1 bacterium]MDZ7319202.1 GAF domain-containing protein [candidate division KSB1 bacterium]MDZ7340325.1 GAF domain-containing protein [candidate division KSB1 bacterium]